MSVCSGEGGGAEGVDEYVKPIPPCPHHPEKKYETV